MSVRAYRVIEIKREVNPTFNLSHDEKFIDFMQRNNTNDIYSRLVDGGGQMELSVESLEKAVKEFDFEDESDIEQVKADIKFAKEVGDDYLLYDCY